jgi:predicted SAM-dependent methyltransferase
MLKLHLGCGGEILSDYTNIDIQPPYDICHDLRQPLPYDDDSVDEIYCRDVIQLFSREEWKKIKKDWYRVLKPGGKIELICWDIYYVIFNFITNQDGERWSYWLQCLYAGQENEYDYFKNAFSWIKLTNDLKEEGFSHFERLFVPNFNEDSYRFIHLVGYKIREK